METKRKIIISVICGIIAVLGVFSYLKYKEHRLLEMAAKVPVVVAATDILEHTQINETMMAVKKIPRAYVQPGAILAREGHMILGQVTSSPIRKGEQILGTKLISFGKETGLAMKIPAGMRAISLLVDDVTGISGLIKPNDFVDILATFDFGGETSSKQYTFTLFQNLNVLAVDANLGEGYSSLAMKRDEKGMLEKVGMVRARETHVVTLAVTPSQAQELVLAQETGALALSLRGIGETERELSLSPATPASITGIQGLMKQQRKPRYREYRGSR